MQFDGAIAPRGHSAHQCQHVKSEAALPGRGDSLTKRMGFTANQNGTAIALYLGCGPGALAPRLLARWRRIGHRWRPKAFGWLLTLGLGQQSLTAEFDIAPRVYVQHLHAQLLANL